MVCDNCDPFDTEILIHGPEQLSRVCQKILSAVQENILRYNSFESDRELIGQASFLQLDLTTRLFPDVMRYHFHCPHCGNCYMLSAETYHGSGAKWCRSGNLPDKIEFRKNSD